MRIGDVDLNNSEGYLKLISNQSTKKQESRKSSTSRASSNEADILRQYQLADPEHYGIPGMDITGRTDYQKIVYVSDEVKEKINNLARNEFINNYGMSDGEELSALTRKYVLSLPENERSSAAWTLGQMFGSESARLHDIVKSNIPGWQAGKAFDRNLVNDLISRGSFDQKV